MKSKTKDKDFYLKCSTCGKVVSSVPFVSDPIVRAYVKCPECLQEDRLEKKLNNKK
jgi:endogenous inhibitor of DNA gyrase (YacG/DUF329 family)